MGTAHSGGSRRAGAAHGQSKAFSDFRLLRAPGMAGFESGGAVGNQRGSGLSGQAQGFSSREAGGPGSSRPVESRRERFVRVGVMPRCICRLWLEFIPECALKVLCRKLCRELCRELCRTNRSIHGFPTKFPTNEDFYELARCCPVFWSAPVL